MWWPPSGSTTPSSARRKEATYKQLKLDTEPLAGLPAEQPTLVLGRFATEAGAAWSLARQARPQACAGAASARPEPPALPGVSREADGITAGKLRGLRTRR